MLRIVIFTLSAHEQTHNNVFGPLPTKWLGTFALEGRYETKNSLGIYAMNLNSSCVTG
jgi:hypothetical protein